MAAYKKDINLFKAAGGERAKSKKMDASKKLILVAILVLILVGGGIGALLYFKGVYTGKLEALEKTADNYKRTSAVTQSVIEEYNDVIQQKNTAVLIEYQSMLEPGFSSDLSAEELAAVRTFLALETTPFSIDNNFEEVVDEVLRQLNLSLYNSAAENFADEVYRTKFLYCALSYMKTMQPVFVELPLQYVEDEDEDEYYWYCYYRGKFVMMLRNTGGDAAALATQLQSEDDLLCSPFCSLKTDSANLDNDFSMYTTVTVGDGADSYTIIAITCKTVAERFKDSVTNIFSQQQNVETKYILGNNYKFSSGTFSVDFTMDQTAEFNLKDVCDAIAASPFFVSKKEFAYEISDGVSTIQRTLEFYVNNEAVNATKEAAEAFFAETETEEE